MKIPNTPPGYVASRIRKGRYFFPGAEDFTKQSGLVCAGWEECHGDFEIQRPSFRYHALELIVGGDWLARFGRRQRPIGPGTVLRYGPGESFSLAAAGRGPYLKYFLNLSGPAAPRLLDSAGIRRLSCFRLSHAGRISDLFEQLISCAELPSTRRRPVARALVESLLLRAGAQRLEKKTAAPPTNPAFTRCRSHLESHYPEIPSISQAARDCHVTPEHFSRLFRKFAGTTAESFLMNLRINHATRMLLQSDMPVKEIALRVGFRDPYHFSRAFKSAHGASPRSFREGKGA